MPTNRRLTREHISGAMELTLSLTSLPLTLSLALSLWLSLSRCVALSLAYVFICKVWEEAMHIIKGNTYRLLYIRPHTLVA
jgi:hypothetical protein